MLRALYSFLLIAALSAAAIWLADNPGDLVLHWRGYEVRTSFVIGIGLLALVALFIFFLYRVVMLFLRTPEDFSAYLENRRRRKGFLALSRGMVAVAAGDAAEAHRYSAQAHKLLDEPPLTLLLAAQAAQLEGDEDAATRYFEAMANTRETEFLGLRGLFIQARRGGDQKKALDLARRAFVLRPHTPWAAQAVFELEAAEENWTGALKTLERALQAKLVSRDVARRRRMVLLTAQAMVADEAALMQMGEARRYAKEKALVPALEAASLDPDFAPAVAFAARLCGETDRVRKGARLIEEAWTRAPHPHLAEVYMNLVNGESAYDRFSRMRLLAGRNREHVESRVALAQAAIGTRDWLAARGTLEPLVHGGSEGLTQRVCELMAGIEEGEFGNRGQSREWFARALYAPEDALWIGEEYRSERWSPINPVTGEFDALVWKVPAIRLGRSIMPSVPPTHEDYAPTFKDIPEIVDFKDVESVHGIQHDEPLAFPSILPDDPGPGVSDTEAQEEEKW